VAFNRVGVSGATDVLADPVVHPYMVVRFGTEHAHRAVAICIDHAGAIKLRLENWAKRVGVNSRDVVRANATATLNECKDRFFVHPAASSALVGVLILVLPADKRAIGLNRFACAAEFAPGLRKTFAHRFTQAMHHEPSALVGDAEHAMHLVS